MYQERYRPFLPVARMANLIIHNRRWRCILFASIVAAAIGWASLVSIDPSFMKNNGLLGDSGKDADDDEIVGALESVDDWSGRIPGWWYGHEAPPPSPVEVSSSRGKADDEEKDDEPLPSGVSGWPQPVLILGLPRSGDASLEEFFKCGGVRRVSEKECLPHPKGSSKLLCGILIQHNIQDGRDPLYKTGDHDVYSRLDVEQDPNKNDGICYFGQVEALEQLSKYHPESTIILNTRDEAAWVREVNKWKDKRDILGNCGITGLVNGKKKGKSKTLTDEDLKSFYLGHAKRIREFVASHPTHQLVEVAVDKPDAADVLRTAFGISKKCWASAQEDD